MKSILLYAKCHRDLIRRDQDFYCFHLCESSLRYPWEGCRLPLKLEWKFRFWFSWFCSCGLRWDGDSVMLINSQELLPAPVLWVQLEDFSIIPGAWIETNAPESPTNSQPPLPRVFETIKLPFKMQTCPQQLFSATYFNQIARLNSGPPRQRKF